uniref:Uncharacterized protein n=1 Tax=Ascaris lumbricoides TaxID=6252 RepID=A0A0M3IGL1_ASCLU
MRQSKVVASQPTDRQNTSAHAENRTHDVLQPGSLSRSAHNDVGARSPEIPFHRFYCASNRQYLSTPSPYRQSVLMMGTGGRCEVDVTQFHAVGHHTIY